MTKPTQYWYVLEHHYTHCKWQSAGNGYDEVSNDGGLLMDGIRWYNDNVILKPTKEELDALWVSTYETKYYGAPAKYKAKQLIEKTDWTMLPDVGISNVPEFEAYRAALREIIKNPVLDPEYPTEPNPVWI
jgi:hypothetical protein